MLQFRDFRKSYGDRLIIAAESLTLEGPFYWLRGGNGSGKTTLLQSVAGMIPFKGRIEVDDMTAQGQPIAYRRAVNMAIAEPVYPDFLTGRDLLRLYTETKRGTEAQADELVERLGAGDFMRDKTGTYSSGMKKKLSLVLAFTGAPRLILLDEPLITLDTAAVAALLPLIEGRVAAGVQVLITSHQNIQAPFVLPPQPLVIREKELLLSL